MGGVGDRDRRPGVAGRRITCAKGSEDLRNVGQSGAEAMSEAENVGWNHMLRRP